MTRLRAVPLVMLFVVASTELLLPTTGRTQPSPCPDPAGSFDFVVGGWVGQQHVLDEVGDSTFVGTTVWTASPVLGGCAFDERVYVHGADGRHVFSARLLRSYDAVDERWELTEADDRGFHVHFLGEPTADGGWAFVIPRTRDGRDYLLRLTWLRVDRNHVRETFERSYDQGETWTLASVIDFYRSAELAPGAASDAPGDG